jgi:protease-4
MRKFGIDVEKMNTGILKTMGIPYRKIAPEEREILKEELDTIHKYFLEEISNNRKLKKEAVKEISSGKIYFGSEAKDLGLVDHLGSKKQAMELLSKISKLKTYRIVDYNKKMRKPVGLLRKLIGGL